MDDKNPMNGVNGQSRLNGHAALMDLLRAEEVEYRVVEHEPEGRTDVISKIRGNRLSQAAKALIVMAKFGKYNQKFFLVVVPGDSRVDFSAIAAAVGADRILMAPSERAEELSGSPMGGVPPFSFSTMLGLIVDPRLLDEPEIVFNAGRLDMSIFLRSEDYLRVARPRIARVGLPAVSTGS